jgi:SAM-dependent methyltransferase
MSFGAIAADYDRLRPSPAPEAVRWLLPGSLAAAWHLPGSEAARGGSSGARAPGSTGAPGSTRTPGSTGGVAVDLGAGTGLLTRALTGKAGTIVAVEPDMRMAAVLRTRSPHAHVVSGRGEAIPLRDQCADAVLVSSAWHWMRPELAVPEIARVLRDGGRFGVIWTSRDRSVDWVRDLDRLREPVDITAGSQPPPPRRRDVWLPDPGLFTDVREASFGFIRSMTIDDLVDMLATYSGLITAGHAERADALARVRAALADRFGDAAEIDVPMRSLCWRADRSRRLSG